MSTVSVGGTMITLRSNRIVLLGFIALFATTLYFFYPSDHFKSPHTPLDPYGTYEAGGIDSEHWHEPVKPKFEKEVARDDCEDGECLADVGRKPVGAAKERVKGKSEKLAEDKKKAQAALDVPKAKEPVAEKPVGVDEAVLKGGVIMPKMENATAKAELGRSAWRVLHLMTLRYPETPSPDDRSAFKAFFSLFARLYPCGDCAKEFQSLLQQYPPQTSSRKTASMWLCSVHNMINERLGKPEFDCLTLNDVYDCGCGPEGEEGVKDKAVEGVKKVGEKAAVMKDKAVDKAAAVKDKAVDKVVAAKDKAVDQAVAAKDKAAVALTAGKDKLVGIKDQAKEKINEVKEKGKAVADKVLPKPDPKKPAPGPNRPLAGMNAKEKEKDGAAAKVEPGMKVDEKRPLEKEEIVYNPKKGKPKVAEPVPEVKEEADDEAVDEVEDEDAVDEELEEEDQLVLTELSGEDEEAEEDDSELLEEEGEDGFSLDSDELDEFV